MNPDMLLYASIVQALLQNASKQLQPEELQSEADRYFDAVRPRFAALA